MSKTKKEIILENARKDPFLKIENLAKKAGTTPRYVRTILSEANISLMKLRKEYARKMENFQLKDKLLFSYLLNTPFKSVNVISDGDFIFNNPEDFADLQGDLNNNFNKVSFQLAASGGIWCINTVVLSKDILYQKKSNFSEIITLINQSLEKEGINISNIRMEIEKANQQIAEVLEIPLLAPLFKVKQTVLSNSEIKILMLSYFNPGLISLSLSLNNGLIIERKSLA